MTRSEIVFQLVCFMLPSLALFGSVYLIMQKWTEIQREKLRLQKIPQAKNGAAPQLTNAAKISNKESILPMQVDAYQRIVLFLERISPNNLIMRLTNPVLPARVFQQQLLDNIRQEYEHNLAQQIFVSAEAWNLAKTSKDETVKIINMAATNLPPTAMCLDLCRAILEISAQLHNQPTERAVLYLKAEFDRLLQIA
ncbi:MAG: hypothetical protein IPM74_08655 [Crocinitomicaceae bacterium]|nr:hypothetical protein [Crocinitomicaceae bacterium]MBK8925959.1 hypothetical protein [Crocinitomicaceae bacterium]